MTNVCMLADSQIQQCGIIFLAYSLAHKLVIKVQIRPNQVNNFVVVGHAGTRVTE